MLSAGQRNHRVQFERREPMAKSASGNVLQNWSALKLRWAAFRPRFGREQLEVGRLDSAMLGTLTVLADPDTKTLTAADRVRFLTGPYAGKSCNILSIVPTPDAREIELLLQDGGNDP